MNPFFSTVSRILQNAANAFRTFPASLICALAFALVTIVRIEMDWQQQEPFNFLFNCLHWSFALGAIVSLTAITAAQSRYDTKGAFIAANLMGIAAAGLTFLVLYFFGSVEPDGGYTKYAIVSNIFEARVVMAMLISYLIFVVLTSYPKEQSNFSESFFMSHKAFFIALIYGGAIMAGTSGVARAFQALLYRDMSENVYMYLGTLSGFLAYAIFLGYFPDFRKGVTDPRREIAQKQPRFIEALFGYILTPILLALTVVLLLWSGKTVMAGMNAPFGMLTGIASAYAIGGTWLYVMTSQQTTGMVKFYRMTYPIAALLILGLEAWAFVIQIGKWGLRTSEYSFLLVWIGAVIASILLLLWKSKAFQKIVWAVCILAVVWVLPVLGFHALPVSLQADRLEQILISEGILVDGKLVAVTKEPDKQVREQITGAVNYLGYAQDARLPAWFDKTLRDGTIFRSKLGFEQTWPEQDNYFGGGGYLGAYLEPRPGNVDIAGYQWAVNFMSESAKGQGSVEVTGAKGTYLISWVPGGVDNVPTLTIRQGEQIILKEDLHKYLSAMAEKYPPDNNGAPKSVPLEDMTLELSTPELSVKMVFNFVSINVDPQQDRIYYGISPGMLYVKEN